MLRVVRPQVKLDAVERRQHLTVADVEADGAHLGREAVGGRMGAVREQDERPSRRADAVERLDGAGLHVHRPTLAVD